MNGFNVFSCTYENSSTLDTSTMNSFYHPKKNIEKSHLLYPAFMVFIDCIATISVFGNLCIYVACINYYFIYFKMFIELTIGSCTVPAEPRERTYLFWNFKALSLSIHFKLRKRKSSEFVDLFPASFRFWTWRDLELLCLVSIHTKTCWFFFYIVVTFVLAPFFRRDKTGFLYCQVFCCLHVS